MAFDFNRRRTETLYNLVTNSGPKFYRHEYNRVTTRYVDWDTSIYTEADYDYVLLNGILLRAMEHKNVPEIGRILKVSCPLYINDVNFEYLLVRKLGVNAFAMIFDGYEHGKTEAVKKRHYEILRKAFQSLDQDEPEAAFVVKVKNYYRDNQSRLGVNVRYGDLQSPYGGKQDLFVTR